MAKPTGSSLFPRGSYDRGVHEVGLTRRILEIAAARSEGGRVVRIVLEVGALAAVSPEALRFAFEALAPTSAVAGAALEIVASEGHELRVRELEVEPCA